VAPKAIPGRPPKKLDLLQAELEAQLRAHNDVSLAEHCRLRERSHGLRVSPSTMHEAIKRLGWTRKKRRWVPLNAAKTSEQSFASKGARVRHLIEARGCELLFLPAYSPDCSPIEEAFSKVKAFLRRVGARTHEALQEAIGQAWETVTAQDALGWFTHCGYQPAQASDLSCCRVTQFIAGKGRDASEKELDTERSRALTDTKRATGREDFHSVAFDPCQCSYKASRASWASFRPTP
jgi:DDE superfamily endonuclease